jgi:hypothetical protein
MKAHFLNPRKWFVRCKDELSSPPDVAAKLTKRFILETPLNAAAATR